MFLLCEPLWRRIFDTRVDESHENRLIIAEKFFQMVIPVPTLAQPHLITTPLFARASKDMGHRRQKHLEALISARLEQPCE